MFDLDRIHRSGLVRHIDHHESLGSTSDRALELAAADEVPLPLLVLTEKQTGGRGRGTNKWWSADGALTFSLVLEGADLPSEQRPRTALACGLAVCESLAELAPSGQWQVKWPNDVFAGGHKACGILCESVPGWPERIVVGIGVNVNNAMRIQGSGFRVHGENPLRLATALVDLDGIVRDLTEVLLAVLDRFDLHWRGLIDGGFTEIAEEYRRRCILTGKTLHVTSGNEQLIGVCRGIDDRGSLVLATESGVRTIVAGSIDRWDSCQ
jgi:BirA family transcriptional regulator, biotin operon repressor / biotin---[acetyl-CoA-carboxylase] ligase